MVASDYAIGNLKNKNAIIFYEDNPRDSLAAFTYREAIERDSFNVIFTQKLIRRLTQRQMLNCCHILL